MNWIKQFLDWAEELDAEGNEIRAELMRHAARDIKLLTEEINRPKDPKWTPTSESN